MFRTKIFIAGSLERRKELRGYSLELLKRGYIITSEWLFDDKYIKEGHIDFDAPYVANKTINDINRSNLFALFTDKDEANSEYLIELGIALQKRKKCWLSSFQIDLIGPKTTIFSTLINVDNYFTSPTNWMLNMLNN